MSKEEIKIIAHIRSRLAGAFYHVFLSFIGAPHSLRAGQWIVYIERRLSFIDALIHWRVLRHAAILKSDPLFVVTVVNPHHSIAGKAETFGKRYIDMCRHLTSTSYSI